MSGAAPAVSPLTSLPLHPRADKDQAIRRRQYVATPFVILVILNKTETRSIVQKTVTRVKLRAVICIFLRKQNYALSLSLSLSPPPSPESRHFDADIKQM